MSTLNWFWIIWNWFSALINLKSTDKGYSGNPCCTMAKYLNYHLYNQAPIKDKFLSDQVVKDIKHYRMKNIMGLLGTLENFEDPQ